MSDSSLSRFVGGLALSVLAVYGGAGVDVDKRARQRITDEIGQNRVETGVCLYGSGREVKRVRPATTHRHDSTGILASCVESDDYLGFLHNHPSGTCRFSETDKASFYLDDDARLYGVACSVEPLRITWKTKPKDWYIGRDPEDIRTMTREY